jgi:hypothetical protein
VIVVSRAIASVFPPFKLGADVVFSTAGLVAVVRVWRRLKNAIFDPYRPELHYMRGPSPKWREKHQSATSAIDSEWRSFEGDVYV